MLSELPVMLNLPVLYFMVGVGSVPMVPFPHTDVLTMSKRRKNTYETKKETAVLFARFCTLFSCFLPDMSYADCV